MPNVDVVKKTHVSAFRKLALGTWQTAYDPSIYGSMQIRMEPALAYIEAFRQKTGKKLTVTHLVTKAVALALRACPDANAILRFNNIYLRQQVDISILVFMEDNGQLDLSSAKLLRVDQKSLLEIVTELEEHVVKIRAKKDKVLEKTRQSLRRIPAICMNAFLKLLSFFSYALNLDLTFLGLPKDAFGGVVVTSIGPLGLDTAYVPLVPYSRVPIFVAPGEVHAVPVVDDGKVVPGQMMTLSATFDHRIVDGSHAAILAKTVKKVFADPFAAFGPV